MKNYLSALGCLAFLLGGSSEIRASDFTLHDPSERPNIVINCSAIRYVNSQIQKSSPFQLHIDVYFAGGYAVISPEVGQENIAMALTSIATQPDKEAEYIVLTSGSGSAIISTQYDDVIIVKSTVTGVEEYAIAGQNCKIALTD